MCFCPTYDREGLSGDEQGSSFSVGELVEEWIQRPADCHVADIKPGFIRGNHVHIMRREVIVARYDSEWSLFWNKGAGTEVRSTSIQGSGVVVILVVPGWSHAIANTGEKVISILSLSDRAFNGARDETQRRFVASTDKPGQLIRR